MCDTNISELENIFASLNIEEVGTNSLPNFNLTKKSQTSSIADESLNKLVNRKNNLLEMAQPRFDLKILDIVPKFEGETNELAAFLEISNTLFQTYWDTTNPSSIQNILLINGIYAKLVGRARSVYCNCISKDWNNVKKTLISHFGDQRNESGLLIDLGNLRQTQNEPSLHFLNRVMDLLNALNNYIDLHEANNDIKSSKKQFYQEHSLNVLLSGLREPQGSIIRSMKPTSLAEAQQFIVTDNNIRYQQRNLTHHQQINNNLNKQPIKTPININNQKFPFIPHFSNNSPHIQSFNKPTFPSGPVNVQPRPLPSRHFPTNKQVFGPPMNVWKLGNHNESHQRPTPMSGISTSVAKPLNKNPQFSQRPRYQIEEVYNMDDGYTEDRPINYYNMDDTYPEQYSLNYSEQFTTEPENNPYNNPNVQIENHSSENYNDVYNDQCQQNFQDIARSDQIT